MGSLYFLFSGFDNLLYVKIHRTHISKRDHQKLLVTEESTKGVDDRERDP